MRTRAGKRAVPVAVAALLVTVAGVLLSPVNAQYGDVVQFDAGGGSPTGITAAPDGTMWFVDRSANTVNHLRVDGTYEVAATIPTDGSGATDVVVGPDGGIWFTERQVDKIGRFDPTTGVVTELPLTATAQPQSITVAHGDLWVTERYGKLARIDTTTHDISEIDLAAGSDPFGITTASDATLWITERLANVIVHYDPVSGTTDSYLVTPGSDPRGIAVAGNGAVWFTEWASSKVGKLDPGTGNVTDIPIPKPVGVSALHPAGLDVGPGGIWAVLENGSEAVRYKPSTGAFDSIPLWAGGQPLAIITGPDGNLWVTEPGGHKIARITAPDTTRPTIDLAAPADGATYILDEVVAADYTCADEPGGSGLASCVGTIASGDPIDTASVGSHTFEVDAADNEGNVRTVTVSYDVVKPAPRDTTAPTISIISPADGTTFTVGDSVKADFTCADEDAGSGLVRCDGTVANGGAIDTSSAGTGSFTVEAEDGAGNTSSTTVHYTVEQPAPTDATAPTIALDVPQDGAAFMVGDRPTADYRCADERSGSGIASCDGTTPDGAVIDTSRPGIFTFTVRASDRAGNHAVVTHTYVVFKEWGGKLALPPAVNDVAAGSAVPIWFNLGDVSAVSASASTSPTSTPVDCTTLAPTGAAVPASVSPTGTKASNGRVMYVWKTDKAWAGSCRAFTLGIAAPTTLYLRFS
jgi:streptogramin lyase